MNSSSLRRLPLIAFGLPLVAVGAGCGALLGLDDFTEGSATSTGGGGNGTTTSSSSSSSASATGAGGAASSTTSSATSGAGGMPMPCTPKDTQDCYSGPAGTKGKGLCVGGKQTCNDNGMGFGACIGEVVPTLENCAAPPDEDCNGTSATCTGTFLWGSRFANNKGDQIGAGVAIDSKGNTLLSGTITGGVDFGGGAITGSVFVAKFDPFGKHLFSKAFGTAFNSSGLVFTDAADDMILVGQFSGALNLGGGVLDNPGPSNVFYGRLAPDGTHLFSQTIGHGTLPLLRGTTDASGNIYLTGVTFGTVDFGGGPLGVSQHYSAFVAKLDKAGTLLYSSAFGGTGNSGAQAQGIGVDAAGNAVIAAGFVGTVDFGGTSLMSAAGNFAVVKMDPSGKVVYAKQFGPGVDIGLIDASMSVVLPGKFDIAVDAAGEIFLAGGYTSTINFGGPPLTNGGGEDIFMAKLDPMGAHVWSQGFGAAGDQYATHVAVDSFGNPVATGIFKGTVKFPNMNAFNGLTDQNAFTIKLAAGGGAEWAVASNGVAMGTGVYQANIAVDPIGNVALSGTISGYFALGTTPNTSFGFHDIFVANLAR
ncbi:MAG: hypothetical protein ABJE95_08655 [Byssovorax sp.]